jgi:FkbM family methyltransferase
MTTATTQAQHHAEPLSFPARPASSSPLERASVTARGIADMVRAGVPALADGRSRARWAADAVLYRVLRLTDVGLDRPRTVRLRDGVTVHYRANRGDILALNETFLNGAYDLPHATGGPVLVDLGANIGLTATWLARRFGATTVIGVEPNPANAALARRNLEANGLRAEVLEAAVAEQDGEGFFDDAKIATTGQLADHGRPVRLVSMDTVLERLPEGARVDLLKLDIEGGEQMLAAGDTAWLDRVDCIVAELHPDDADIPAVVSALKARGFTYHPVDTSPTYGPRGTEFMATFARPGAGA